MTNTVRVATALAAWLVSSAALADNLTVVSTFGADSGFAAYDLSNDYPGHLVLGVNGQGNALQAWNGQGFVTLVNGSDPIKILAAQNGMGLYSTGSAPGQTTYGIATLAYNGVYQKTFESSLPGLTVNTVGGYGSYTGPAGASCGVMVQPGNASSNSACVDGADKQFVGSNDWADRVAVTTRNGEARATLEVPFGRSANGIYTGTYDLGTFGSIAGLTNNGLMAGVLDGQATFVTVYEDYASSTTQIRKTNMLASVSGATNIQVHDLSGNRQAVGQYTDASGEQVAFLFNADDQGSGQLFNLNQALVGAGLRWMPGTHIGINDRLQMVLTAYQGDSMVTAIVSTPTTALPEPGTWSFMLLGLGGIVLAARRRHHRAMPRVC